MARKEIYGNGNPLRVVTLCSGYDSQCLAINRLGIPYELVAWSEIDKYAIQAHDALFPQWADRNLGDMTKIDWAQVPDFDLLTYSTPCQSISSAGLQHGFTEGSGTRSSIIWNVRDAIKVKRPRYLLLENVKAMVSKKFLPMFQLWCDEVERLGYRNYHQVLNAKDFGVPQNRERIFLVSIRDDVEQSFQFPKPQELTLTLDDVLEDEVDRKYYLSHERIEGLLLSTLEEMKKKRGYKFSVKKRKDIANCITDKCGGGRKTDNFEGPIKQFNVAIKPVKSGMQLHAVKTHEDCTYSFDVTGYAAKTVGEFIAEVLGSHPEYSGHFYFNNWEVFRAYDCSKMLGALPHNVIDMAITNVTAHGAYNMIDFKIDFYDTSTD